MAGLAPERFGKYHVLARIAQGGMAEVYKVKTIGLAGFEKIQALKRILPAHAADPHFIRSFVDEARIAVALNHRNIVQVFELAQVDGDLLLAMELVEGVNLRQALDAARGLGQRLPLPLACHILAEVASGLEYAHRRLDGAGRPLGIVHGDVSPPNLMLSTEGYVKILDFGVARAAFAAEVKGRVRGKPRYMAPEQTRGEPLAASADVWALGCVAWELLAGRPAFDGPDVDSIRQAIRRAAPPPVSSLVPEVPEFLDRAIMAALAGDPRARGTAMDLGAACARTLRLADPGLGSRALGRWLGDLFPTTESVPDTSPDLPAAGGPSVPTHDTTPEGQAGVLRRLPSEPTAATVRALRPSTPAPAVDPDAAATGVLLDEKRRVLAVSCRLDGGDDDDRRQARRLLAGMAYRGGAVVHADDPGGLLALFGLETPGEDDVAQAARFALDAHEAVAELPGPGPGAPGTPVRLSIGACAALVAPRRAEGGEKPRGFLLLGGALEEARAIAALAEPGRALFAAEPGRRAAENFLFRELPPLRRGARRLRVVELAGARPVAGAGLQGAGHAGVLHGRQAELARIDVAWRRARAEDRRLCVVLVGEPGLGKSRLVAEAFAERQRERPRWVHTGAQPGGDAPFAYALDMVASALRVAPERGHAARTRLTARLAQVLGEGGVAAEEADDTLATIEHALELRDGVAPGGEAAAAGASLPGRMAAAILTLRALAPGPRPRLTVLEDWHWADGASAEALRQVIAMHAPRGAELVLVTTRPGEASATPLPVAEDSIVMGELEVDAATALVRERLGAGADEELVDEVVSRGGGNPLFLGELAAAATVLPAGELPENARAVIAARVGRLSPAARAVAQHAAVAGASVRRAWLDALVGAGAAAEGVAELVAAGILDPSDGEGAELQFRHGLLQEVIYEAIAGGARTGAHRRLAERLAERLTGEPVAPAVVARHFALGGEPARAADFDLRAGRLALAAADAREAGAAYTRVLALVPEGDASARAVRREALGGRAEARFRLGEHAAQKEDLDALASLAGDDPAELADVRCRAAARHLRLGEYAAAVAASEAAERAAERAGDARARGEALRLRAEAFERQADFERALEAVEAALVIFREIGATTDETRALIGIGRIHLMGSRFDEALAHYLPALERTRAASDAWLERIIANNVAVIHLNRKEFPQAMSNAQRSLAICRRFGDRAREGDNASIVGTIYLELGCHAEAREWAARGLAIHAETGSRWSRADALVYAAHIETMAGDVALGLAGLGEAIDLAREIGAKYVLGNAKNQRAYALLQRRGPGDAARAEDEAMEAAELGAEAALPSVEIQGRSRAGWARLEQRDVHGARAATARAVALLDRVRCIEWSEEEILWTHYRVLRAAGDPMAPGFLARAFTGLRAKLDRLGSDPAWQKAFAAIPLHRQILAEWGRS